MYFVAFNAEKVDSDRVTLSTWKPRSILHY